MTLKRCSYLYAFVPSHRGEDADDVLNNLSHVKRRVFQCESTAFDLTDIKQIIYEALQEFQLAPHYGAIIDHER